MSTRQTDLFEKDTPVNFVNDDKLPALPDPKDVQKPTDEDSEFEIEVVDDVPPGDRRAKPDAKAEIIDPDSEELKKEIDEYGEGAQKRIKQLSYQYHEERRQRESAHRQNEEAIKFAEQVARENNALKSALDNQNQTLSQTLNEKNAELLEKAESDYKLAYENGDSEGLIAAQKRMSALYVESITRPARPPAAAHTQVERPQETAPVAYQQPNIRPPDEKATSWLRENPWFQAPGNEHMTGLALGLHEKLVKEGYDPTVHDEYYTKINDTLHAAFPDYFGQDEGRPAATARKSAPVAAPTRGGKAPRKVQLTSTQVVLAKRLGLTLEQYAAQVAKEMASNG
jgi:hypothetical protein